MLSTGLRIFGLGILLASAGQVLAEEPMEQHGAHEHGVATLAIAVGEEGLEIMLESPAANLLGFEHAATSDADRQKLAEVTARLEAGADLFTLTPAAECELKDAEVVSALLAGEAEETHNDMEVTWSYACAKPAELIDIEVKLFSAFPQGLEHIKAEWVTNKGASGQELGKDETLKLN